MPVVHICDAKFFTRGWKENTMSDGAVILARLLSTVQVKIEGNV